MPTCAARRTALATALSASFLLSATAVDAAIIQVRASDNLQNAINAAQPGDVLMLEAGATFTGNFVLPVKAGAEFITIRSAAPDSSLPGATMRIGPSHAPLLPKIQSPNNAPALATAPGAHHWRLLFIEFRANRLGFGDIMQIGDGSQAQNQLSQVPHDIHLDRLYIHGDADYGQKRAVALNASAVVIRNCYIADIKGVGVDTQAIGGWNGPGPFLIENNYLEASGENFLLGGSDPGITGLVSENVTVRRNYFTRPLAWRNPIVQRPAAVGAAATAGGGLSPGTYSYRVVARKPVGGGTIGRSPVSDPVTAQVASPQASVQVTWQAVPGATEYYVYGRSGSLSQYWVVTGAAFTDTGTAGQAGSVPDPDFEGDKWLVKNLFELKNARNVLVEENMFENNWAHGQSGYAILFTPRNQDGRCTWCVVEDVTFQKNIVRNVAAGFNILGTDDLQPSLPTRRIRISHNLFYGVRRSLGGSGWFILMGDGPSSIVVDHNTVDSDGLTVTYVYGGTPEDPAIVSAYEFTNNAMRHGVYGIHGTDVATGNPILAHFFPGAVFQGNWLQGGEPARYPAWNYFSGTFDEAFVSPATGNFHPAPGSILIGRATDGTAIGADIPALERIRTVVEGISLIRSTPPLNVTISR